MNLKDIAGRNNVVLILTLFCILGISQPVNGTGANMNPAQTDTEIIPQQDQDSVLFQLNLEYLNAVNDKKTPFILIPIIDKILQLDPEAHNHWFNLGMEYIKIHEYDKAITALNHGLELYPSEDNPTLLQIYISLSFCYNKTGKHQLEKDILDRASRFFPDHPEIVGRYAVCAHSRIRYTEADYHKNRLILILRGQGMNESDIAFSLGKLFANTDYLEAEKYFRTANQYDPDNAEKKGCLAWSLIQNALKINEGMTLMEQAIAADPDNPTYIHQQGYGYYTKGNLEQALTNLNTARNLYQEYNYDLDNHIKMVEDALLSQNNN